MQYFSFGGNAPCAPAGTCLEGVRLHWPEFTRIVRRSIVTDHYLFLRLFKYGYQKFLHRVHRGRARRNFQNEGAQKAGKRYFDISVFK